MWRSQDIFGGHVVLTYKGKNSYQTNIGAFVSILVKITLAMFIVNEFYSIFSRKHPRTSTKIQISEFGRNPAVLGEPWDPRDRSFDIAIGLF
jgi:hypothetical protein